MSFQATPPPGWYPDPIGGGGVRWWDGADWTEHFTPYAAGVLKDEVGPARRAALAVMIAAPLQAVGYFFSRAVFKDLFDEIRRASESGSSDPILPKAQYGLAGVLGNLVAVAGLVAGVLFLIWFFRSAENAKSLAIPARRSPTAGVVGFLVPIINLWWPYQSVSDLFPDDRHKPMVLRWFLLWVVGSYTGFLLLIISALGDGPAAWALLVPPGVAVIAAGLAARQVITKVVEAHQALAQARPAAGAGEAR